MTTQETKIVGADEHGNPLEANMHQHERGSAGPIVHTVEHHRFNSISLPFLNETNGAQMNKAVSFGANKSVIHDGGSTSSKTTGTTTSTTANHLIDSGETFSDIEVGMSVHNTTDSTYASVTAVASNDLTLDADIFTSGGNARGQTMRPSTLLP